MLGFGDLNFPAEAVSIINLRPTYAHSHRSYIMLSLAILLNDA